MASHGAGQGFPQYALILLVGPSGAGKSTWAAARFRPSEILASDDLREMVAGDAADQTANRDAFRLLHLIARARLQRGLISVVDATNLTRNARAPLLKMATAAGRPVVAVVFDMPLQRSLRLNASRPGRQVPEDVVRRQHAQMQTALAALPSEGYLEVRTVREVNVDDA